jgi:hypothetical protein
MHLLQKLSTVATEALSVSQANGLSLEASRREEASMQGAFCASPCCQVTSLRRRAHEILGNL